MIESITDNLLSTRTMICKCNVVMNHSFIFDNLPLFSSFSNSFQVVAMYHKNIAKGKTHLFKKKNLSSFRNAVNILIEDENENCCNIKLSKQSLQITGCKQIDKTHEGIKYLFELILHECKDGISLLENTIRIKCTIVMTNYIYDCGFRIDKRKLHQLMNEDSSHRFYCLFDTSFGYTGYNLKMDVCPNDFDIKIPIFIYNEEGKWSKEEETYSIIGKSKKFNSFLLFHSGKIIVSGMLETSMNDHFLVFKKYLTDNKEKIEEFIH
jgi:hypothetical protein